MTAWSGNPLAQVSGLGFPPVIRLKDVNSWQCDQGEKEES